MIKEEIIEEVKEETKIEGNQESKQEVVNLLDVTKSTKPQDIIKEECLTGVFTNENTFSLVRLTHI